MALPPLSLANQLIQDAAMARKRATRLELLLAQRPDLEPIIRVLIEAELSRAGIEVMATVPMFPPPKRGFWRRIIDAWKAFTG